jgi:serine/alanine adding enzyme
MIVRLYDPSDKQSWDSYVLNHPHSTHCHLSGWKKVFETTYGHKGYYFLAEENSKIKGILPLFYIKSILFGNHLVSMPFLNYGGILADFNEVAVALMQEAINLCFKLNASFIEFRHLNSLDIMDSTNPHRLYEKTHKVRMLLKLPASKEELFKSFKSKLRSQIVRPQKEGMEAIIGGPELLDSFYKVFSINMRDLGSPVHSKKLFKQICNEFPQGIKICIVNYQNIPVAAGSIFCFRDTIEIPWASSLKKFNKLSPNMLLYWSLIGYACDGGFQYFDFGRSTPGEGTYKFKEQWGASRTPLCWQYWTSNENNEIGIDSGNPKYQTLIKVWQNLPLFISTWLGPKIRKSVEL